MAKRTDWILWNYQANVCECKRCGETYPLFLPCSVDMFLAIMRQFIKEHRGCKERK